MLKLSLVSCVLATSCYANNWGTTASSSQPSPPSSSAATSAGVKAPVFEWGRSTMRGVNTGGWLVLEPWVKPSMFVNTPDWVVDEWTYGQYYKSLGPVVYRDITAHWDSWITEADFQKMASVGLNTVRIQIGFWSLIPLSNGESYLVGAFDYLKRAVKLSDKFGLKVVVDLHGLPGGQNGWDSSGIRGAREWFNNATNIDRTLAAVDNLVVEFSKSEYNNAVTAVEVANEASPYTQEERAFLHEYLQRAYRQVRKSSVATEHGSGMTVMLTDASLGLDHWGSFMPSPEYQRVALDHHVHLQANASLVTMSYDHKLRWYCNSLDDLAESNSKLWTVVGEFTTASTDCTRWINGRGVGARFNNSMTGEKAVKGAGNCSDFTGLPLTWSKEYLEYLGRSFETQTWVYEQASGWIYWTWKTESAADWSFESGLANGWIPTPITAKPHGLPCLYTCSSGRVQTVPTAVAVTVVLFQTIFGWTW